MGEIPGCQTARKQFCLITKKLNFANSLSEPTRGLQDPNPNAAQPTPWFHPWETLSREPSRPLPGLLTSRNGKIINGKIINGSTPVAEENYTTSHNTSQHHAPIGCSEKDTSCLRFSCPNYITSSNHEKTQMKPKLGDTLQNDWPVSTLLKGWGHKEKERRSVWSGKRTLVVNRWNLTKSIVNNNKKNMTKHLELFPCRTGLVYVTISNLLA